MNRTYRSKILLTGAVAAALAFQMPAGWAQPLEVVDVERTQTMVQAEIERLVADVAARDPEFAQEIERQAALCERDMQDGRLDHEGFTRDIESFREARDMMERMMGGETPEGERPERFTPTPEMMEHMSEEMEQLMAERPELAEYAKAEFGEMMKEFAEHEMGSHEGMERMTEMAERFGHEGFEHGGFDPREFEHYFEGHEFDREFFEREFGNRLDGLAEQFLQDAPPPPEGAHTPVEMHTIADNGHAEGHWDGPDPDNLADHAHPLGTGPHTN